MPWCSLQARPQPCSAGPYQFCDGLIAQEGLLRVKLVQGIEELHPENDPPGLDREEKLGMRWHPTRPVVHQSPR
jgi:hypothetical protein